MGILVIDVGTSSMRGTFYDEYASDLFQARRKYCPVYLSENYISQDAKIWENALFEISEEIMNWCKDSGYQIEAVSLTAQRSSVIPVDENGEPLMDTIMWQDKRNLSICEEMKKHNRMIIQKSGTYINPVFSGSKMTWIKREANEVYKKTYKFLVIADYLLFCMTGNYLSDRTYGSRSHLMNIRTGAWDQELLDIFEIREGQLCQLIDPGECHGNISSKFSKRTGIKTGTPVYSAGGDQQCAALGMGVLDDTELEITSGTGAFIIGLTKTLPETIIGNPVINFSALKGYYIVEASILTCSAAFDWFCRNFYKEDKGDYSIINKEIRKSPPGANGCLLLPFFQGRATPLWNPKATASFTNVTLSTTRGDMARALLEGVAYEIRNNIDMVEGQIGKAERILIGGGLSKSDVFNQIQADVYGKQLLHYENSEVTSLGAWISTSVQCGLYDSVDKAFQRARSKDTCRYYLPIPENTKNYQEIRQEMNRLYKKIY
ncbi:FGGY-family carbohydrate kinase [Anaerostipes faecalis]|uniref:FGGY-family carbohydrate kinase n=1 Tax=Anaerostipes faecalis TaxID=2738446 RepID=UPI003F10E7CF